MNILKQDIPCWYEFSMIDTVSIGFMLNREALDQVNVDWVRPGKITDDLVSRFGFSGFTPPNEKAWSYNEVFKPWMLNSNWVGWKFTLPRDIKSMLSIQCSLDLIRLLWKNVKVNSNCKNQLIVLSGVSLPLYRGGADISFTLSSVVIKWILSQQTNDWVDQINQAVYTAYHHMNGSIISKGGFMVHCSGKYLFLNMPSSKSGCWLNPAGSGDSHESNGYILDSHNCDYGFQQLSWLVGMVRLHDLIRADGY